MRIALFIAALLLVACSQEADKEDDDSALYDAAKAPLDKAEAAQDAALEAKEKVDAALEEAEGDDGG